MSSYLWTYFLQDDIESFQQLLAEATVQGRTGVQKSLQPVSITGTLPAIGSPYHQALLPTSLERGRSDQLAVSSARPNGYRDITITKSDVNWRDSKGMTLLHHIASSTSASAVTFALALLTHPHVDLFLQDFENGWTALHRAFYAGNIAIARAIILQESQTLLGQASGITGSAGPALIRVKDKEGHGPYDLYAATIHDRTLHHNNEENAASRNIYSNQRENDQDSSDDELEGNFRDSRKALASVGGDELYTFGSNRNITLGFGDEDDRLRPERVKLARPGHIFQRFYQEYVTRRAYDVSKSNAVYGEKLRARSAASPALPDLPSVIQSRPVMIQDMQMAKFHSVVLTDDPVSNLYVCGHGTGGRLGTGSEKTQFTFKCLEDFGSQRKKITAVAPGQDHTLALTEQGELFTWGSNHWGQLGCGLPRPKAKAEDMIQSLPKQIFGTLKREFVVGVAASAIHSVVHTSTELFTFGRNAGQLGLVDSGARSLEAQGTPRNVTPSRFSSSIRSVSAIDKATICLLDSFEVFVFANFGCTRLDFLLDHFGNSFLSSSFLTTKYDQVPRRICKVTSGGDTICAMSTAGEVYTLTVKQAIDPSSSITASTTNPNKIKAGLSTPACVWSLKKDTMAARDVGVDADGSIIISTEAGSVWRRVRRAKAASVAATPSERTKDFKFSRVPNLTRVVAVRASAAGAFCAIRQECDVTKTQIIVNRQTLWNDVFKMLSFGALSKEQPPPDGPGAPTFWRRPNQLETLITYLRHTADVELSFKEIFARSFSSPRRSYDMLIASTTGDVEIPVHRSIILARSPVLRAAVAALQVGDETSNEHFTLTSRHDGLVELRLQGLDFLTLVELVLYSYTDSFVGFWNLAREAPHMAYRFRLVRNELMKVATRLDLRNLEAAVRRMLPSGDLSLHTDMALAVSDQRYFESGDALVLLADGEFLVHSDLLVQRCPFFEGLFQGSAEGRWLDSRRSNSAENARIIEVDLKHMELHIFQLVVRYLYTDCDLELFDEIVTQDLDEFLDIVMEVLGAANELMLDRLSQICQAELGRHVNTRNICQLLNATAPCSVTEFKEAGLEYLCLNLEAVLANHWLEELDEDLLLELDTKVRENQLDYLPFARSGRAEADLLEKYSELVAAIDRARQAKLDALLLQTKFVDKGMPLATSFEAYDEDWETNIRVKPKRSRASRGSSASTTPKLKPKVKVVSTDGDDELTAILPAAMLASTSPDLGSPNTPSYLMNGSRKVSAGALGGAIQPSISDRLSLPLPRDAEGSGVSSSGADGNSNVTGSASRPWAANTLPTAKLGIKDILSQASTSSTSNITLGLSKSAGKAKAIPPAATRLSQKERKKQQRQTSDILTSSRHDDATPSSPWQTVSPYSKPASPSLSSSNAQGPRPGDQSRSVSTPHLTMRQTVANAPPVKQSPTPTHAMPQTPARAVGTPARQMPQTTPTTGSPSSAAQAVPIRSVRHTPRPAPEISPNTYMHQSLADIIHSEQAGKNAIKEAAAARSLQDIQQEQEFLEWWDHQSRKAQEAEGTQTAEASSSPARTRGSAQRGRGTRRRRGGASGQGRKSAPIEG